MKNRIILIILTLIILILASGVAYSAFHSDANLQVEDQKIASFIFNSEKKDHISVSLSNLKPGDTEKYNFSVSNNGNSKRSDVIIDYKIIIKTLHVMPTDIKLYTINDDVEQLIMSCDENYSRNENNELVCNTTIQELNFKSDNKNEYILKVNFPDKYNDESYSDLIDYFDIDIKSWQKLKD